MDSSFSLTAKTTLALNQLVNYNFQYTADG